MNWKFDFSPETSDIFAVLACDVVVYRWSLVSKFTSFGAWLSQCKFAFCSALALCAGRTKPNFRHAKINGRSSETQI